MSERWRWPLRLLVIVGGLMLGVPCLFMAAVEAVFTIGETFMEGFGPVSALMNHAIPALILMLPVVVPAALIVLVIRLRLI
jgi:hypothetical protein